MAQDARVLVSLNCCCQFSGIIQPEIHFCRTLEGTQLFNQIIPDVIHVGHSK